MNLLTEHGVPGWQWVEKVRAMTHAPPFPVPHPPQASLQQQDKNFMPFIYNMLPYIILTDIKDVYFYLSRTSVSFMVRHFSYYAIKIAICPAHTDTKKSRSLQALLDLVQSEEYQKMWIFLQESSEYLAVMDALGENGFDVKMIYDKLELEFRMTDF